jgi:FKBP-type peptidyl-prolyl cis-trans isomerase FklB
MKTIYLFIACVGVSLTLMMSCSKSSSRISSSDLKDLNDSVSYAYGYLSGKHTKEVVDSDLNVQIYNAAFERGYMGEKKTIMTEEECMNVLDKYSIEKQEKLQADVWKKAQSNIKRAEKFLKENKSKKGVITTKSGLQYEVIKQGKGEKPRANHGDRIRFFAELSILDTNNKVRKIESDFDGSRTTPNLQGVDNDIAGFTEVVQLMNAGSHYKVWIHPNLGYGLQDSPIIPVGSLLILDIKVTEVLRNED